jgi:hypothetical protein
VALLRASSSGWSPRRLGEGRRRQPGGPRGGGGRRARVRPSAPPTTRPAQSSSRGAQRGPQAAPTPRAPSRRRAQLLQRPGPAARPRAAPGGIARGAADRPPEPRRFDRGARSVPRRRRLAPPPAATPVRVEPADAGSRWLRGRTPAVGRRASGGRSAPRRLIRQRPERASRWSEPAARVPGAPRRNSPLRRSRPPRPRPSGAAPRRCVATPPVLPSGRPPGGLPPWSARARCRPPSKRPTDVARSRGSAARRSSPERRPRALAPRARHPAQGSQESCGTGGRRGRSGRPQVEPSVRPSAGFAQRTPQGARYASEAAGCPRGRDRRTVRRRRGHPRRRRQRRIRSAPRLRSLPRPPRRRGWRRRGASAAARVRSPAARSAHSCSWRWLPPRSRGSDRVVRRVRDRRGPAPASRTRQLGDALPAARPRIPDRDRERGPVVRASDDPPWNRGVPRGDLPRRARETLRPPRQRGAGVRARRGLRPRVGASARAPPRPVHAAPAAAARPAQTAARSVLGSGDRPRRPLLPGTAACRPAARRGTASAPRPRTLRRSLAQVPGSRPAARRAGLAPIASSGRAG